jgi:hypothetical protein
MVFVIRSLVPRYASSKAALIEDDGRYDVSQGPLWAVERHKPSQFQSNRGRQADKYDSPPNARWIAACSEKVADSLARIMRENA